MRKGLFWVWIGCVLLANCQRDGQNEGSRIAKVGKKTIAVQDFLDRVEKGSPSSEWDMANPKDKENAIQDLIDEKLLAIAAEKQKIDKDWILQRKVRCAEIMVVAREWVSGKIRSKAVVGPEATQSALNKSRMMLKVRYLISTNRDEAQNWKKTIDRGKSFYAVLEEVTGKPLTEESNQVQFGWGQIEESLENAAYALEIGQTSPPVKTSKGFVVLRLEERLPNPSVQNLDTTLQKQWVQKILLDRKIRSLSQDVRDEFMKDKPFALKMEPFSIMTEELKKYVLFTRESGNAFQPLVHVLNDEQWQTIRNNLTPWLSVVLVEFKGGQWTLEDFLQRLWFIQIPILRESPEALRKGIRDTIRNLVVDDLLAMEAMVRKFDQRPEVSRQVKVWKDAFLAQTMKNTYHEAVPLASFLETLRAQTRITIDRQKLHEITPVFLPFAPALDGMPKIVPDWPRWESSPEGQEDIPPRA
jgi:hypothetical protein